MSVMDRPVDQALKHIAIFASGTGSNAQKIIDHFRNSKIASVVLIVCNNPQAGVLSIANKENIPYMLINRKELNDEELIKWLHNYNIDLIVLAGFLWKIPISLIQHFKNRIINIHPALLPKYGGKNMYGHFVHEAVIDSGEKESGITIHYVDEIYDHGKIIFQTKCIVDKNETPASLAEKIHHLEHEYYPAVIEKLLD